MKPAPHAPRAERQRRGSSLSGQTQRAKPDFVRISPRRHGPYSYVRSTPAGPDPPTALSANLKTRVSSSQQPDSAPSICPQLRLSAYRPTLRNRD
jgi:hypothetical protein